MAIKFNGSGIVGAAVGTASVDALYLGATELFPNNITLSFYESRGGVDIGDLYVYLVDEQGVTLDTLRTTSGETTAGWTKVEITFAKLSVPFHVAWRHSTLGNYRGDYAIDTVDVGGTLFDFDADSNGFVTTQTSNTTSSQTALQDSQPVSTTTGDDRWSRLSGATGSSSTGPSGAHSGSYYLYTETSSGNFNREKWLFSPVIN